MKKIVLFALTYFIVLAYAHAQNIAPYWSMTGNSNAGPASKLGTTNRVPLRFFTNNLERMRIDTSGKIGIGTINPLNMLTVKLNGSTPAPSWLAGGSSLPAFLAFGENQATGFNLATAADASGYRPVLNTRRSRGTLAVPTAVHNNDYLASFVASGYDGTTFQNPATIDFYVDGSPSPGNVPGRISFVTGSNSANRAERLKVGSTGDFNFNNGQVFLKKFTGGLGIGIDNPVARLDVRNGESINSVYVTNTSTNPNQFGIRSSVNGIGATSFRTAAELIASGVGSSNTGVSAHAASATENYGGNFISRDGATSNIGVSGYTRGPGGSKNYAVYGSIINGSAGNDFAGYFSGRTYVSTWLVVGTSETQLDASVSVQSPASTYNSMSVVSANANGNGVLSNYSGTPANYYAFWGLAPVSGSNRAAYFSGNVTVTGTFSNPSDERLKEDIKPLTGALDKLMKVSVNTYNFKSAYKSMNLPDGKQYGYLAQNLESIFPELVENTADKTKGEAQPFLYKSVNYIGMVPILTKALQEEHLQRMKTEEDINALKAANEALKTKLENIEQAIAKLSLQIQSNSTHENAKLDQNSPNPFSKKSIITCYIPASSKSSMIIVYAIDGKAVKTFNALSPGINRVEVVTNTFAAGSYTYTLFVDGKTIATRQMVIAR